MEDLILEQIVGRGPTVESATENAKLEAVLSLFQSNLSGYISEFEVFKKDLFTKNDNEDTVPPQYPEIEKMLSNPYLFKWPTDAGMKPSGIVKIETEEAVVKITIDGFKVYLDNLKKYLASKGFLICKNGLEWPCALANEVIVDLPSYVFAKQKTGPTSLWNEVEKGFALLTDPGAADNYGFVEPETYAMFEEDASEYIKVKILSGQHQGKVGYASIHDLLLCDTACRELFVDQKNIKDFKKDLKDLKNHQTIFSEDHRAASLLDIGDKKEYKLSLSTSYPATHIVKVPTILEGFIDAIFVWEGKLKFFKASDSSGTSVSGLASKLLVDDTLLNIIKQNVSPPAEIISRNWNKNIFEKMVGAAGTTRLGMYLEQKFHLVYYKGHYGYVFSPYVKRIETPDQKYINIPFKILDPALFPQRSDTVGDWKATPVGLPYYYTPISAKKSYEMSATHAEYRVHIELEGIKEYNEDTLKYVNSFRAAGALHILDYYGKEYNNFDQKFIDLLKVSYGKKLIVPGINKTQTLSRIEQISVDTSTDTVHALVSTPVRFVQAFPEKKALIFYDDKSTARTDIINNPIKLMKEELSTVEWWDGIILSDATTLADIESKRQKIFDIVKGNPIFDGQRVYFTARFDSLDELKELINKSSKMFQHYSSLISESDWRVKMKTDGHNIPKFSDPGVLHSMPPLDLSKEATSLKKYLGALEELIKINTENNPEFKNPKNKSIQIAFDIGYNPLYIICYNKLLKVGLGYFFKKEPFNDTTTNAFIHRLRDMLKEWEGFSEVDKANWVQWLARWLHPVAELTPNTGTGTHVSEVVTDKENSEKEKIKIKTEAEILGENSILNSANEMNILSKKASKDTDVVYDRNLTSWNEISKKIKGINDVYEFLLNNVDVKLLVETIMKCTLDDLTGIEEMLLTSAFNAILTDVEEAKKWLNKILEVLPEQCMLALLKNIFIIEPEKDSTDNAGQGGATPPQNKEDNEILGEWVIVGVAGNEQPYVALTEAPDDIATLNINLEDTDLKEAPIHESPSSTSNIIFLLDNGSIVIDQIDAAITNSWLSIKAESPPDEKGKMGFVQKKYVSKYFPENTIFLQEGTQFDSIELLSLPAANPVKIKVKSGPHLNSEGWIKTEYIEPTGDLQYTPDLGKILLKKGSRDGKDGLSNEVRIWQEYLNSAETIGGPVNSKKPETEGAKITVDGVFGKNTASATKDVLGKEDVTIKEFQAAKTFQINSVKAMLKKPLGDIEKGLYLPTPISALGISAYAPPGFFAGKETSCDRKYVELVSLVRNFEELKVQPDAVEKELRKIEKKIKKVRTQYASCMQAYEYETFGKDRDYLVAKDTNTEQIILQSSYEIANSSDACDDKYNALVDSLLGIPVWPGSHSATPAQMELFGDWINCTQSKAKEISQAIKKKKAETGSKNIDYSSLLSNKKDYSSTFPTTPQELLQFIVLYQDIPTTVTLKANAPALAVEILQGQTCSGEIESLIDWIIEEVAPDYPALGTIIKAITAGALALAEYSTGTSPSFKAFAMKKLGVMDVDKTGDEARQEIRGRLKGIAEQVILQTVRELLNQIKEICENSGSGDSSLDASNIPLVDDYSPELASKLRDLVDHFGLDLSLQPGDESKDTPSTSGGKFDIIEFINNITSGLSPKQKCNLVNGRYSNNLFKKVRANIKRFYPRRVQLYFGTDKALESFFNEVSPLIGSAICDTSSINQGKNIPSNLNSLKGLCSDEDLKNQKKEELLGSGLSPDMADWIMDQEQAAALNRISELGALLSEPDKFISSKTTEPCELLNQVFAKNQRIRKGIEDVLLASTDGIKVAFSSEVGYVIPSFIIPIPSPASEPAVTDNLLEMFKGGISANKLSSLMGQFAADPVDKLASGASSVLEAGANLGVDALGKPNKMSLSAFDNLYDSALQTILTPISSSIRNADISSGGSGGFAINMGDNEIKYALEPSVLLSNVNSVLIKEVPSVQESTTTSYRFEQAQSLSTDVETYINLTGFKSSGFGPPGPKYVHLNIWDRFKNDFRDQIVNPESKFSEIEQAFAAASSGMYSSMSRAILRKILEIISNSKFFKIENLKSLNFAPTAEELVRMCSKPGVFDLDTDLLGMKSLVEKYIERFFSLNDFCNEPVSPDIDPTSKVLIEASLDLFIRASILDSVFVGIFAFSKFDMEAFLKDNIIKNYFYVKLKSSLLSLNLYSKFKNEAYRVVFERKASGENIPAESKAECLKFLFDEQLLVLGPAFKSLSNIEGASAEDIFFNDVIVDTIPVMGQFDRGFCNAGTAMWYSQKAKGEGVPVKRRFFDDSGLWKYGIRNLEGSFFLEEYLLIKDILSPDGVSKWDKAVKDIDVTQAGVLVLGAPNPNFQWYGPDNTLGLPKGWHRGDWLRNYVRLDDWKEYMIMLKGALAFFEADNLLGIPGEGHAKEYGDLNYLLSSPWTEYFDIKVGLRLSYIVPSENAANHALNAVGADHHIENENIKKWEHLMHSNVFDNDSGIVGLNTKEGGQTPWSFAEIHKGYKLYTIPLCEINTTKYLNQWFAYKDNNDLTKYGEGIVTKGDPWKMLHFASSTGHIKVLHKSDNKRKLKKLFFDTPQFQAIYKFGIPFENSASIAILFSMLKARENLVTKDFLLHTKLTIKGLFDMSIVGNKIDHKDPLADNVSLANPSSSDGAADQSSMAPVIAQFIAKTPLLILKGLTEMTDPNIKTVKKIYEFSNTIFKEVTKNLLDNIKKDYEKNTEGIEDRPSFEEWARENKIEIPDPMINLPSSMAMPLAFMLLPSNLPYGVGFPPPPFGVGVGPAMTPMAIPYLGLGLISDDIFKGIDSWSNKKKEEEEGGKDCETPYKDAADQLPIKEQDTDDENDIF